MCMSKTPKYEPPAAPQEAKAPAMAGSGTSSARKRGLTAAPTLLTGPSGIDNSQLRLGKSTLLGS